MTDDKSDRPIDRVRKSALSMKVGDAEDGSIGMMIDMKHSLYSIHEHAIYAVKLADQIDPRRTNASVPNTHQKILSLGAQDPEVARTFLTAHALFRSMHLGAAFQEQKAVQFAFDFLTDIAAMIEMKSSLDSATEAAMAKFGALPMHERSIRLPSLGDAPHRCDAFTQKIGHAVDTLEQIARLFYPGQLTKKWIDSLVELAAAKHGKDSGLANFMREAGPSLLFLRKLRNMIEHPQDGARITVHDFKLLPSLELIAPSVDIERAGLETASGSLTSLMEQVRDELVLIGENLIGQLAGANLQSFSGFKVLLVELPTNRRPKSNPHQRLSYGIEINGVVQPLG